MDMIPMSYRALITLVVTVVMSGCQSGAELPRSTDSLTPLVWATNVGGPAYAGLDGVQYQAEESIVGGSPGRLDAVKGTQDPVLYQTYRVGDVVVSRPLQNGIYDVTFHFAEPAEIADGERVFDVVAEGYPVIEDLDVKIFRDGQVHSALTVTAAGVVVTDGVLDLTFSPQSGEPILSAIVVRRPQRRSALWRLVWEDEFDGDGQPDPANWTIREWPARVVNDEDQAYTNREKNVRVENGMLVIEAHKERWDDAEYTSGRIYSSGKRDFLYGRFEARAKLPRGVGTWAAIWMLPSQPFTYATNCREGDTWQGADDCDAWPNSGEIDILEHVGYQHGHLHGTVHNRAYYFVNWQQRKGRVLVDDVAESFHDYTVEWSPERIDVFVDDTLYFTYMNEHEGWREWPYDRPFHLIVNLAIGGNWGRAGGPIDDAIFPQQLLVDYVRVYQKAEVSAK